MTQTAGTTRPFTIAGEGGGIFGQQDGEFELWAFPTKVLSHFRISAELSGYPVPIDVNSAAASIEVSPGRTTIVYSHTAFTLRQHMIVPRRLPGSPAPVVLFEISSLRPLDLTFRFTPDVLRMWPAPNYGRPSAEWLPQTKSGFYVLHTDNDQVSAAVGIPGAEPGILPPYQERPQFYPVEFKLHFDPARDAGKMYPLVAVTGSGNAALAEKLSARLARVSSDVTKSLEAANHTFDRELDIETPDAELNRALRWAALSVDQFRVQSGDEYGLTAGYFVSADSARPGFGWFFGRDTLWTLYSLHSRGDFTTAREALEFLFQRQRDDGKIMHEYSQSAGMLDWKSLPYFYASADATPLIVMTTGDYVRTSGDVEFLKQHWDGIKKAWEFTRTHDSDQDGVYENTEGHGWVEGWPPKMPHQEMYLAAVDQQASHAMRWMADLMHDAATRDRAEQAAFKIKQLLQSEYVAKNGDLAFSRNPDGSFDWIATIYPSVAWWTGQLNLQGAQRMFERWASSEFSTDWGARAVGRHESLYDPISYHQGSVWPLFTGWLSLAEYRTGQSLSAYAHLRQTTNLTWLQDPGAVTELLSGEYFQPLGRSSSRQMWSSAMITIPAMRGMLGLEGDALNKTLTVNPQLPAQWDRVTVKNFGLGDARYHIEMTREARRWLVRVTSEKPQVLCLSTTLPTAPSACPEAEKKAWTVSIATPPVEVGWEVPAPELGSQTHGLKILHQSYGAKQASFDVEGPAGSTFRLPLRSSVKQVSAEGAVVDGAQIKISFPEGSGYQRKTFTLHW